VDKTLIEILLIEDNLPDAEYFTELLAAERTPAFVIHEAGRLSDGLLLLAKKEFRLVLLDLGLPDSQGIDTLLSVRKQSPEVPIIVLTGLADEEFALTAINAGADEYLIKGQIDRTLLVRTIRYTIERKRILEELRRSGEQYRLLFETSPFPMWVYRRGSLTFLAVNNAAIHLYGYPRDEFLGMGLKDLHLTEDLGRLLEVENDLRGSYRKPGIWKQRRRDGSAIDVDITTHDVTFNEKPARLVLAQDVTELKKAEETIKYQTYHDLLTGLPNRAQLKVMLGLELMQAEKKRKKLAVFHIDLDRFRAINDTLGHAVGDKVISAVTERLGALTPQSDSLARIGSDEFVILVPDVKRAEDAAMFAQKVVDSMRKPLRVDGHELFTTVSVGISMYPEDGRDPEILIKNADIAVSSVKDWGRNSFQFFNAMLNRRTVERLLLESYLRQSLERGEMEVYYQPQISIRNGKMIAVEALARWHHPELGLLEPKQFIPMAEEIGFISSIDGWVMRTAAAQNRAWLDSGLPPLCMTVNISAPQFQQPAFAELVKAVLEETGLEAGYLDIEITESTAMRDIDRSVPNLKGLHELGIELSIDDFGTGYSSLNYLKRFPVHKLKIDQSFIKGIVMDKDDQAIVRAIIAMGHALGLTVVAEGVETREQLAFLTDNGCDEVQGYLFSEPVPADSLMKLLAA
jgi:diguanylate cyclase (GGDEF)-like protein/PAS domain S-box-containing protein